MYEGILKMARTNNKPLRVLQVCGSLNRGGQETWFMDVMRNTSREEFQIDACVTRRVEGGYEEEFQSLGGRIFCCPLSSNIWSFLRCFEELLHQEEYDIVHSHQYYFTGLILRSAARSGVPKRIAHLHPAEDYKAETLFRRLYIWWMRRLIIRYGTDFLGPTKASLEGVWGPDWERDPAKHVVYNGVSVDRFTGEVDIAGIRDDLCIPVNAQLVINVGRFVSYKRQGFLVKVAEFVLAKRTDVYFLLIGKGPLKDKVEEEVRAKGLQNNFRFIAGVPSIDDYWMASDVFAFPSLNEGFGIVIIEAALAGLKIIAQDIAGVREAAEVCSDCVLLPAETDPSRWAEVLLKTLSQPKMTESERQEYLKQFPFTIENSIQKLREIYNG